MVGGMKRLGLMRVCMGVGCGDAGYVVRRVSGSLRVVRADVHELDPTQVRRLSQQTKAGRH